MIIRRYKKWAPLVLPTLLDALKDKDIDSVKGALHTLRVTLIEHTLARNSEYTETYVVGLIHAFESFDRVNPAFKIADSPAISSKYGIVGDKLPRKVQQAESLDDCRR